MSPDVPVIIMLHLPVMMMVTSAHLAMAVVSLVWQVWILSVAGVTVDLTTLRGGVCPTVLQGTPVMVPVVSVYPVLLAVITVRQMVECAPHAGRDGSKHQMDSVCHQRVAHASLVCTLAREHA